MARTSASAGGDLGVLPDDQMAPFIRDQVKKMNPGEVSAIFGGKKAGGFYIVRLVDVRSSDTERLEKMKEEIRTQLSSGEYGRQISLWLERQRQIAYMHRAGEAPVLGSKN